jgi:hypothetical protein
MSDMNAGDETTRQDNRVAGQPLTVVSTKRLLILVLADL